jgi:hypothetical protein
MATTHHTVPVPALNPKRPVTKQLGGSFMTANEFADANKRLATSWWPL